MYFFMLVLINKIAMLSDLGSFASGTSAPLGSTNTRFLSNVALPNIFGSATLQSNTSCLLKILPSYFVAIN